MTEDNRRCYRIGNNSNDRCAVVKIRRRELTVRLLDESANGFAVSSAKLRRVRVGDSVLLRTAAGWSEVVVVRKQTLGVETVLGLSRVGDLPDPRDIPVPRSLAVGRADSSSDSTRLGSLLTVLIGGILVFWLLAVGAGLVGRS